MKESGEWKKRGASQTVEQGGKDNDLPLDVIWGWINSGQLEFRQVTTQNKTSTRILTSQLAALINADPVGPLHLARLRTQADLYQLNKDITYFKQFLDGMQQKKIEAEKWLAANPMNSLMNYPMNYRGVL